MLIYCNRCIMPHTKPDLHIDEQGVCSVCRAYENREEVDWAARKLELLAIVEKYRGKSANWDCVIPVSGGKDSTYQVIRMLQLGVNPLCVTSSTCDLSDIGRKNIDNLKRLGVDHLEFSPNPLTRAKLNRAGLTEIGDIAWPEHVGIFTIPVRVAVQFGIPLVAWGENSHNEYGGPADAVASTVVNRRWLEEFGGLPGMRLTDLTETYGIAARDVLPYSYPTDEELRRVGVTGIFLRHYLPWDENSNALIAQAHGFTTYARAVEGGMVNYEKLDNYQHCIDDHFKFLKFGFARATDIACLHVRRGRITRRDALEIARLRDGVFPWSYLGKSLEAILGDIDLSTEEFIRICDRFTNKKIFRRDASGMPVKDKRGNLEKINDDNLFGKPYVESSARSVA